ncbi:MAG: hypothetical protein M1834_000783 [Cirrosporium novae-zelandiae]|nr:MAG: hypothetical protein M1834_000783 [Cirrosporium novae-zelandiae]
MADGRNRDLESSRLTRAQNDLSHYEDSSRVGSGQQPSSMPHGRHSTPNSPYPDHGGNNSPHSLNRSADRDISSETALNENSSPILGHNSRSDDSQPPGPDPKSLRQVIIVKIFHLSPVYKHAQLSIITISSCIGMGFYVKTGTIFRIGGAGAVIYGFAFVGLLSLGVMHNLARMLGIWPVPGALIMYVKTFVDEDLGNIVGIFYCFTQYFSFVALATTVISLVEIFETSTAKSMGISAGALALPIWMNLTEIRVFRKGVLFFGGLNLAIAFAIIMIMNWINPSGEASTFTAAFAFAGVETVTAIAQEARFSLSKEDQEHQEQQRRQRVQQEQGIRTQAEGCETRLECEDPGIQLERTRQQIEDLVNDMTKYFQSSEEITSTGAQEKINRLQQQIDEETRLRNEIDEETRLRNEIVQPRKPDDKFELPTKLVPAILTVIYTLGGWIITQNLPWNDDRLPRWSWDTAVNENSLSLFVISAGDETKTLAKAVTALLIINTMGTSSTALFIASRTLYALTKDLANESSGLESRDSYFRIRPLNKFLKLLGRKSAYDVPYAAVLASGPIFIYLPLLKYGISGGQLDIILYVFSEMGSVCCVLVWGFETFAAFRFLKSFHKHKKDLMMDKSFEGRSKVYLPVDNKLWYWIQWCIAVFSMAGCLIVVFVGGPLAAWQNPTVEQYIAVFLMPGIFLASLVTVKAWRYRNRNRWAEFWSWKSWILALENASTLGDQIRNLENVRIHTTTHNEGKELNLGNLWGVIPSLDSQFFNNILNRIGTAER